MKLSDVVIRYRQESGLSQRQLAERAGLSHTYISMIESGRPTTGKPVKPTVGILIKLANAMHMSLYDLFMCEDVEPEPGAAQFDLAEFASANTPGARLSRVMNGLNEEGWNKVIAYAADLLDNPKYRK